MSNLYAALRASMLSRPDAILLETTDRSWTGADLDAWVARYAEALTHLGLAEGDRIAVQVEKSADNVALYLAVLRLGAIYVPLNTAYQPREIEYFLGDATPRIFVTAPQRAEPMQQIAKAAGVERVLTLGTRSDGTLAALVEGAAPSAHVSSRGGDDLAVICYTSGTTGRSKGAMISHENLLSNARTLVAQWGFSRNDVLLHALPLYHIHGLFVALHCALLSGARILLQPKFDAGVALAALGRATVMMGVPTFYTRLLAESTLDRDAVRNVRLFVSGSAPLLTETFEHFEARTGQRILERYGMTETGMIASNPLHGERRAGTVGPPLPGVSVRVTQDDGTCATEGAIGTVEVKGPNVFQGYWRMPEKTAQEFRDGYFITGDLGLIEPDGYVRLVGRAKDMIISGGLNVYPKEIESLIDAVPGVIESAVFAVPHPDFGEAVAAAVTREPGASVDADAIVATLRPQLASFKMPKRVFIVDELPRNAMSKVQKNVLRERYATAFAGNDHLST
jgi:malonyl-CoA/methylmalonyl-CoA synthetase